MSAFTSLMNNTFYSFRRERTADGQGGWAITYAPHLTFLGRIRPATSAEKETAQQEGRAISHVLYVVYGTDIERGDMVIGGRLTVDVLGVREPSQAAHHLEIDCIETQRESTEVGS